MSLDAPILPNGESLDDMLQFDPLQVAEQITGESYKTSEYTTGWGMMLMMANGQNKDRALKERDDTCFTETIENYLRIIEKIGFKRVLAMDFVVQDDYEKEPRNEKFFVYWHDDGLLLATDTFRGNRNAAKVWYNWLPKNGWKNVPYRVTSSGGWNFADGLPSNWSQENPHADDDREMYWRGDHDAREAICHNLAALREHGSFMRPWKESPFLWLLHHGDTRDKDYDYKKINAERMAMLPDYVRECVGKERQ